MSGHFSTLLRSTVQTLLCDHDVYITDWKNARDVPRSAGPFGFDDYVDYVITFFQEMGPGAHLLSVCQPCVPALAAVAIMAEDKDPATPRSMTRRSTRASRRPSSMNWPMKNRSNGSRRI
jgi:polyhydroxyalkanoate depolymerase